MMPSKWIRLLITVAAALSIILLAYTLLHRPSTGQSPFASSAVTADKITLNISTSTLDLVKEGDNWRVRVSSPTGEFKADPEKVKPLVAGLKATEVEDVISQRADSAAEFELDPAHGVRVTLSSKEHRIAEGVYGKQAPDFTHIYFRFMDKTEVYLARGMIRGTFGDGTLNFWRDRSLLTMTEDQILTIYIQGPGFKTALARSSDTWSCGEKVIESGPVWGLLGLLAHLKSDDFVDPAQHPELKPEKLTFASVTTQLMNGTVHELHIGRPNTVTHQYPVSADKEPVVAWVAEATVQSLLRKPADFPLKK